MPIAFRVLAFVLAVLLTLPMATETHLADAKKKKPKTKTIARTFVNTGQVAIPANSPTTSVGPANPFPSSIQVSGFAKGTISDVNVTLKGFSHHWPADVDILLVAPNGRQAMVMSDVGNFIAQTAPVTDLTIKLDDEAATPFTFGVSPTSGTFKPTNIDDFAGSDSFPAPAPLTAGNAALSVFDGGNPNGTWQLFIQDDVNISWGSLSGGWELEIEAKIKAKKKKKKR